MLEKNELVFISENISESIISVEPVHGGSINQAYLLKTKKDKFFLKKNSIKKYPEMFQLEEKGLQLLRNNSNLIIPIVKAIFDIEENSYLVLEWIDEGTSNEDSHFNFGRNLAIMHSHSAEKFGLKYDNYIGSLKQVNSFRDNWNDFFIENRVGYQLQNAFDEGNIDKQSSNAIEKIYQKLSDFFPLEKPSLLHGDLWSGNFMIDKGGNAVIYDPAVYYGHRLMDLGMTKLFGGFSNEFYEGYQEEYKLERNWHDAINIANIYPLLVHVNLFGTSYLTQIKGILKKYV